MIKEELAFLQGLYRMESLGAFGVSMTPPMPNFVDSLVAASYCSTVKILNPHNLPDNPEPMVRLTDAARAMLDANRIEHLSA